MSMGWKEDAEKNKIAAREYKPRQSRLGLGATPLTEKEVQAKKKKEFQRRKKAEREAQKAM